MSWNSYIYTCDKYEGLYWIVNINKELGVIVADVFVGGIDIGTVSGDIEDKELYIKTPENEEYGVFYTVLEGALELVKLAKQKLNKIPT